MILRFIATGALIYNLVNIVNGDGVILEGNQTNSITETSSCSDCLKDGGGTGDNFQESENNLDRIITFTVAKSADYFCSILALLCVCIAFLSIGIYKFIKVKCCIKDDKHPLEMVNIVSKVND